MNPVTHHDTDISPELEPLHLADKPDGPGAAMVISAGIGFFVLGFLTVLAEASAGGKEGILGALGTFPPFFQAFAA